MKRLFTKALAALLAAAMLSLCACSTTESTDEQTPSETPSTEEPGPAETPAAEEIQADETLTTDILVIGGGGAGLSAAISAAENGKNVILLEKMGYLGGATLLSGGIIPAANTAHQEAAGISDSVEQFARDIFRPNHYSVRSDLVYTVTDKADDLIVWLEGLGAEFTLTTDYLYYGQSNYRMHQANGGGQGLTEALIAAAEANENITIMLESPAIGLATEGDEVVGAYAESDGKTILINAENTILATSGFGANKEMIHQYIPEMESAYPYVAPGATGEGIIWGQELGAAVANMKAYQGHGTYSEELHRSADLFILYRGGILVNQEGQRFTNEHMGYSELTPHVLAQPDHHAYIVFNQENADATSAFQGYVEADVLYTGATAEELAADMGVPADALAETFARYQESITVGEDEFNRTNLPDSFDGPYYAIRITGDLRHTQGGLVTDVAGHVLREDGTLIKGLYAAGGVTEGFSSTGGPGYMSGNGLLQALVFGREAGQYAATETRSTAAVVSYQAEA